MLREKEQHLQKLGHHFVVVLQGDALHTESLSMEP